MADLPRARAMVRLDGPGHIMPIEPVTPPDSRIWIVLHLPAVLAFIAIVLLFLGSLAIGVFGIGYRSIAFIPGAHYFYPLVGAAATTVAYVLFVRVVERRPTIAELDTVGWLKESVLGYLGGIVLSSATFVLLIALGGVEIIGFYPITNMLSPFIISWTTAIVLELIVCGLCFRSTERLLGSWLTLLVTMIFFGTIRMLDADQTPFTVLAVAIEAGLLFAALYMMTRRLWAAIGLNAGWKLAQVGFFGGASSEIQPHGLVITDLRGPNWLTGWGSTDSSVPALCVNALVLLLLLVVAARLGRIVRPVWQRNRTR